MKRGHLKYLACPMCKNGLSIDAIEKEKRDSIEKGTLRCSNCNEFYSIINYIPRFVPINNYAEGFGLEWTLHAHTQYDSYTGTNISEKRFFEETKWPRKMKGQLILEVGSGGGRFTEQAVSTGATIISIDYSQAVESNYKYNGHKNNLIIAQGDIYNLPVKENLFDKVLCIGVLQHTPDPKKSFMELPKYLKPGGSLVIDIYANKGIRKLFNTKYWIRPITKRMDHNKLYSRCKNYVELMWPLSKLLNKIPHIGKNINWALLIADYRGRYNLSDDLLREWAILDTFDMLSPAYDNPQSLNSVKDWFMEANLDNIEVIYGYNGIEGRGTKKKDLIK